MTPDPVQHVAVGFGWSSGLLAILNLLVGGALVAWIKQRPKMREIEQAGDAKLIDVLTARVQKLEEALDSSRVHYEQRIDRLQAEYEAAQKIARHELANAKMRFRALVMLLKRLPSPPTGLTDILNDIEVMEAEQAKAEALEKGAAAGAKVAAATTSLPATT